MERKGVKYMQKGKKLGTRRKYRRTVPFYRGKKYVIFFFWRGGGGGEETGFRSNIWAKDIRSKR